MEITNFLSKEFLSSFVGTSIAVELIIHFTKELPLIKKIPTRLYTVIISLIHLFIINISINSMEINIINIYCLIINAFVIALILTGGYDFILGNVNFSIFSNMKNKNNFKNTIEENSTELKKTTLEISKIDNENFNNNLIEEKDIKKENNINMN